MKTIINSESNRPAPHAWRALCLAAAFLLGFAVLPVSANRLAYFRTVPNTDFASAGVGAMRDTGSGVITLAGVTGAVTRAYLYWAGPMNSINPTADAIVAVNNQMVVGVNIGISQDNCWGYLVCQAYRADVTALVQSRRNGSYNLSGFVKPGGININGASLLVFFNDSLTNNNRDMVLFDGNDSNAPSPHDDDGWNISLPGIRYKPGTARMQLHVSDGQTYLDEALVINGVTVMPRGNVFSGDTVPGANNGPGGLGRLWDIKNFNVAGFLSAVTNTLQTTHGYAIGNDCVDLVVVAIDLPAGAAPVVSNQPPTLVCATNMIATTNPAPIMIQADAADADGDALTYQIAVGGTIVQTGAIPSNGPPTTALLNLTNAFSVGMHVVTFTVNDGHSSASCAVAVNVIDTNKPAIACSSNLVVNTRPGTNNAVVTYLVTATDNFPGVSLVCLPASGNVFPKGTTTVNCTAVDAKGNSSTCSFTVTVVDDEPPTINCSTNIVRDLQAGKSNAVVNYIVTATDNLPGVRVVCLPTNGSTFPAGVTTVTCTATDTSSNSVSCPFTVTIRDTQPPDLRCTNLPPIYVETPRTSAFVNYTNLTVTDNLPGVTIACTPTNGSIFPLGTNLVTCTATDAAGNSDSCDFAVVVGQIPSPCPGCTTNTPPLGFNCPGVVDYSGFLATNLPGFTLTCSPTNRSFFPLGTNQVNCSYTNALGRLTNYSFTLIVADTNPPSLTCPTNIVVSPDPGRTNAVVNYSVGSSDDCSSVTLFYSKASGSVFPRGTTTVTVTGRDASGNSNTCQFTVTVLGAGPVLAVTNLMRNTDPGLCSAVVTYGFGNPPVGQTIQCLPPSGAAYPKGITLVQCTATNLAGQSTNAAFTITVLDKEKPTLVGPTNITIGCITGKNYGLVTWRTTTTDNCPDPQTACVPPSGSLFTNGLANVRCTATDGSTNSTNYTFQVRVIPR